MRRTGNNAFTLLEVILAIALVVGLMGSALGFYQQVSSSRRAVLDEAEFWSAHQNVMNRITTELRSATQYETTGEPIGMVGDNEQMEFLTLTLPEPAVWLRGNVSDDTLPPECDVQQVTYSLATVETEDGDRVVTGLQRSVRKYFTAITFEEGEEDWTVETDLMAPGVRFLHLRYYDGRRWEDVWTAGVPMGVEITVGATARPEDMDLQEYLEEYETSRRIVNIPGAQGSQGG